MIGGRGVGVLSSKLLSCFKSFYFNKCRNLNVIDRTIDLPEYQKCFSITRNVYGLTDSVSKRIFQPYTYEPFTYTYVKRNLLISQKKLNIYTSLISRAPVKFAMDQLSQIPTNAAKTIKNCIEEALEPFRQRNIPIDEIYIKTAIINRGIPIKSVRFQPYLGTRPLRKRISHYKLVLCEGVPLPRNVSRYYECIRRIFKDSDPLHIRRKEKLREIITWRYPYFRRRRRQIK